ncbi:glycine cleavage system aminomethyltransferase GcvT [uncultured Pseudoteredinibacter sp.]|uniref:glycine cleavage system aminomethyltransferase GcvT n=1 Tax=uncultured Pseudoteredinibacter sp. TaxID=1641701 RepID=UPI002612358C|nr:glycine cleavage system aminomethyltransferase GcvT [uncultured Pseudoteredinibacter sp.]
MTEELKTPLYDLHVELGAKMVPFAGYSMPVQYPLGIKGEHLHCRDQVGLFDVSHMGQLIIRGANVASALEKLIPVDLEALKPNQQTYAVLTSESGGILDDLIICKWDEETFFLVVNAACKEQDIAHLQSHLKGFEFEILEDQALLAVQGLKAAALMQELAPQACELTFMNGCHSEIDGMPIYITRSGYTGEDGFEISVANGQAEKLARLLLSYQQVEAIGLGARDSLRLEAGLCLYGHDMNTETSPIEASLIWSISKNRRSGGDKEAGFLGSARILNDIAEGVSRKRVGFLVEGRVPVREGAGIFDAEGNQVGEVTSGGFGPSINAPLAMGYVPASLAKTDTKLIARVRNKDIPITVAKTPFVPQRYFRG